ncbi:tail completion protein gp17 [Pseudobacteroides cellulosolvens]|uniref:Uncharacterized protein n=1 Tax=Pseudobacteroides cellulosolvens ATCC 35603 = DSM 2933 TaxID=398512 RepID=A0A0L6JGM3_9FIRM|nr:DUF3168 domain-containing protein [Pseudobacteroides cellulosolvens]KNY24845.1 Protein of unknown function DUF3168 [Pseudobacteroides cellulosolvens ATCC 35603 = DSM 2933]
MNTIEFSKAIRSYLLTKHPRVYKEKAPATATFPYITFNLPSSSNTYPSEDFTLEIDIWDDKEDTTSLETLTDSIDGDGDALNPTGLNIKTIVSNGLTATFYRETRGEVIDDDPRINRRQLRYRVRTYYKGV